MRSLGSLVRRRRGEVTPGLPEIGRGEVSRPSSFVSASETMRAFLALASRITRTTGTVLVLGETGTGKEWLARAIHAEGSRGSAPFVAVNCAALADVPKASKPPFSTPHSVPVEDGGGGAEQPPATRPAGTAPLRRWRRAPCPIALSSPRSVMYAAGGSREWAAPTPGRQRVASRSFRRGSQLGKYRLDRRLGRGAFSEVWRARDTVEHRHVALKITLPEVVDDFGRAGVEHEARIASRLVHPNILRVYNADWVEGLFILATDLAAKSLADYPGARRSPRIALRVVRDIAAGLAYAHSMRVLHMDVKPENILIFSGGQARLADFGLSRLVRNPTRTYSEAGTLGYMAPEQAYGRPRLSSDIFSLGLIGYEILTGKLPSWPFTWPLPGYDRFEKRVPEPIRPVLKKAASFDPQRRYVDGVAFHRALEAAFSKVETNSPRPRRRRAKRPPPAAPLVVESTLFARYYGKGLDLRYSCYRCDGPISEAMSYCPWCGTHDNSFIEVTFYELVCPECERGVHPEWTACPRCYAGRFQGNGRRPRKDPKAVRTCSRKGCSGQLQLFMRYCPECKQKVRRLWSHPDLRHRCKRCRWPVSRESWRFCPWCGRREPKAGTFELSGRAARGKRHPRSLRKRA